MKKATPEKADICLPPQNPKERIEALKKLNYRFLKDIFDLLKQLKRSGIGKYAIKENEIVGFNNSDISIILEHINYIYSFFGAYTIFNMSGLIPVGDKYLERTFMTGVNFDLAYEEVKDIVDGKRVIIINTQDNNQSIFPDDNVPNCYSSKRNDTKRFKIILCLLEKNEGRSAGSIADWIGKDGRDKNSQEYVKREIKKINTIFRDKCKIEEDLIIDNDNFSKKLFSLNRNRLIFKQI